MKLVSQKKLMQVRRRLRRLYGDEAAKQLVKRFYHMIGRYGVGRNPQPSSQSWNRTDVVLITYGDQVQDEGEENLQTLNRFLCRHVKGAIKVVHILPFYPWSSDDGFSVIDYRQVDPAIGDWADVRAIGQNFDLMFDLVLNHCSSKSSWFKDFSTNISPARHYFIEGDPDEDLSAVTRPRTTPVLTKTHTREGETHVWTTFSADQVDLNWQNPDVLFEFIDILMRYISEGARIIRLDAVAFLWKKIGTNCIHLPETHEVVKLLRDIVGIVAPEVILLTETNVPHEENISYFGKGDEAHMVYNFALPPLVLHALLTGSGRYLTEWANELKDPPKGCSWFNFTASHDGIGVRPVQDILPKKELDTIIKTVEKRGGHVSRKANPDGTQSPYELNITYYDALGLKGEEELSNKRFLCSQAIVLAFRGIPAIYFHSLTATCNYHEGVEETGRARTINRRKWQWDELDTLLSDETQHHAHIFSRYLQMIRRRANHPAFHPDADMQVHSVNEALFVFTRHAPDNSQTIFCLFNLSDQEQLVVNPQSTEQLKNTKSFYDILSAKTLSSGKKEGIKLAPYQAMWLVPRE